MKTSTKLALISSLGLALTALPLHSQPDQQGPPGPPNLAGGTPALPGGPDFAPGPGDGPPGPGSGDPQGRGPQNFRRQQGGAPGQRLGQVVLSLLDKYDVNKDGVLDQTELATLRQDIQAGKIAPPARNQNPPNGPPGPRNAPGQEQGSASPNSRGPGQHAGPPPPLSAQQILAKFDANKDGKLDETELAAFVKDMQAHRPPPPPGFPGTGRQARGNGADQGGPPAGDGPPPFGPPTGDGPPGPPQH